MFRRLQVNCNIVVSAWLALAGGLPAPEDAAAGQPPAWEVEHSDPLPDDPALNLHELVELTLEQYPDRLISQALSEEADSWDVRGGSWLAGSTQLLLGYDDDRFTQNRGYSDSTAEVEFTPWFWGQREAALLIAEHAHDSALKQSAALKLEVARLVREALWNIALADIRLQQAQYTVDISAQLLQKVRRRVELGDLARADLLLAESEHLQNRSQLIQAEAELMHSRKAYTNLTRINRAPADYHEHLSQTRQILPTHPQVEAAEAMIARKQATVEWAKTTDTINQPKLNVTTTATHDPMAGNNQTAGVSVIIPFGHLTYDAPEIAAAYLELNRMLAQREHLHRFLERNLHEAEHALEVSRKEVAIGNELKKIAEDHLKMMETSFSAGEINLLDLLKIQARSLQAIRNAKEQEVKLQRNISFYNQAVGELP